MFLIDWLISGTIDILLVNEDTNCAVVGDWKTNRGGLKFSSGYYKKIRQLNLHNKLIIGLRKMNDF